MSNKYNKFLGFFLLHSVLNFYSLRNFKYLLSFVIRRIFIWQRKTIAKKPIFIWIDRRKFQICYVYGEVSFRSVCTLEFLMGSKKQIFSIEGRWYDSNHLFTSCLTFLEILVDSIFKFSNGHLGSSQGCQFSIFKIRLNRNIKNRFSKISKSRTNLENYCKLHKKLVNLSFRIMLFLFVH